jgi:response regulator NasT
MRIDKDAMKRNLHIAIADDEPVVSMLLKRQLADLGHIVTLEARTGRDLLQLLTTGSVDLVITDINMENLDGLDAAELISARYGLPVILMSGRDIGDVLHRLGVSPAFAYLSKPFDNRQLQAAIMMTMQRFKQNNVALQLRGVLHAQPFRGE